MKYNICAILTFALLVQAQALENLDPMGPGSPRPSSEGRVPLSPRNSSSSLTGKDIASSLLKSPRRPSSQAQGLCVPPPELQEPCEDSRSLCSESSAKKESTRPIEIAIEVKKDTEFSYFEHRRFYSLGNTSIPRNTKVLEFNLPEKVGMTLSSLMFQGFYPSINPERVFNFRVMDSSGKKHNVSEIARLLKKQSPQEHYDGFSYFKDGMGTLSGLTVVKEKRVEKVAALSARGAFLKLREPLIFKDLSKSGMLKSIELRAHPDHPYAYINGTFNLTDDKMPFREGLTVYGAKVILHFNGLEIVHSYPGAF